MIDQMTDTGVHFYALWFAHVCGILGTHAVVWIVATQYYQHQAIGRGYANRDSGVFRWADGKSPPPRLSNLFKLLRSIKRRIGHAITAL